MGRPRWQNPKLRKTDAKRPRWTARVKVDVLVDRDRRERRDKDLYFGFVDEVPRASAREQLSEQLKQINNTPLVVQSQVVFKDLAKTYIDTFLPGAFKPSSRHTYEYRIKAYLIPAFGEMRLCDIDPLAVQQWVYKMQAAGLGQNSRASNLKVLRSIFELAEEWGYFTGRSPCKRTKIGPAGDEIRPRRALEPIEARNLLVALDDQQPLGTIVQIALFTGLRISELLGLTWGAIDTKRQMIEVRQARSQQGELSSPKSEHGRRRVSIGALSVRLVRPGEAQDSDLIWPRETYIGLLEDFKKTAKALGIDYKGFGFHSLRRTYATLRKSLEGAAPSDALVRDMGHSSATMTEWYITRDQSGTVSRLQEMVFFSEEGTKQ